MFDEVEKCFETCKLQEYHGERKGLCVKIISNLTNILKTGPEIAGSEINDRVYKVVDNISEERGGIWGLSELEWKGELLISFLKELSAKGCIQQIDKIFRSGDDYPLIKELSTYNEEKFFELFNMLPKDYQNELLSETITFSEGNKE